MRPATRLAALLTCCLLAGLALPAQRATAQTTVSTDQVMLLMDTSGSMREDDGTGRLKIAGAKAGLIDLINQLPNSSRVGLMTYPGDGNCGAPTVHYPVQRMDAGAFSRTVSGLPEPDGNTPTGSALQAAAESLRATPGSSTIVLVSDGLSNCGPPPCEVAKELVAQGVALTVNTIGFRVDAAGARELQCIADATQGMSVTVEDGAELGNELRRQMRAELGLTVTIPATVPVTSASTPVIATVTNDSGLTAVGVQVSLTPESPDAFLGVVGPVVQWGNLGKQETRTHRWNLQVSPVLEGKSVRVRVRVTAANAAPVERTSTIEFSTLGDDLLPDDSPLSGFEKVLLLGDSFSAGDGAYAAHSDYVDYKADLKRSECRRSDATYAHLLFGAENVTNLACSGAVFSNLATRDDLSGSPQVGNLTQLQELDYRLGRGERFDAVFLTVGGNDMGFVDIVKSCSPDGLIDYGDGACVIRDGNDAKSSVDSTVTAVSFLLSRTYPRVAEAFARHGLESPPIIVSAYPMMTPNNPTLSGACQWGGPMQKHVLSGDDLQRYATFQRQVNEAVEQAVATASANGTPVYFAGETAWAVQPDHTVCGKDPWINPLTLAALRGDDDDQKDWSTPLHPDKDGHRAWALALARWSDGAGPLTGARVTPKNPAPALLSAGPVGTIDDAGGVVTTGPNDLLVTGVAPGSLVLAQVNSRVYPLSVGTADADGTYRARVHVDPDLIPRGGHSLVLDVVGADGAPARRRVPITVVAPVPYVLWVAAALGVVGMAAGLMGLRGRRPGA